MESTQEAPAHLEAELWREVSQHLRFEESSTKIVELLRERAPVLGDELQNDRLALGEIRRCHPRPCPSRLRVPTGAALLAPPPAPPLL